MHINNNVSRKKNERMKCYTTSLCWGTWHPENSLDGIATLKFLYQVSMAPNIATFAFPALPQ